MLLSQIKAQLDITSLDLVRSNDKDGKPTGWLRYWNDQKRLAVVIHQDVVGKIKANPNINTLALKHEEKATKTGKAVGVTYDSYIIISATSIETVL